MPEDKEKKPETAQETATIRPTVSLRDLPFKWLNQKLHEAEDAVDGDILTIYGGIWPEVDTKVRMAIESLQKHSESLLVILHTGGGMVEETKNIVQVMRKHYEQIHFLIPVRAMSAGTILAMSGDKIYMDYFSRLGPIDPQVMDESRTKQVPALSYLHQYKELIKKDNLSMAELTLLNKLDLADLHSIELAADLAVSLITNWLTESKLGLMDNERLLPSREKRKKATEIAKALNNHQKWLSHGYSIHKDQLAELGLVIDDYSNDPKLARAVWEYFAFLIECVGEEPRRAFVHSRGYL